MSSPYRLSDAERNEAIEALTDAYVDGRLGSEEFEERMTKASSAVHAADLDPLFADLPPRRTPGRAVQPSPGRAPRRRLGPPPQAFALLPIALVLAAVSLGAWWLFLLIPVMMGLLGRRMDPIRTGPPWMSGQHCWSGHRGRRR